MAMLHYPQAMKKAQEEIDRVIGRDRLPEHDDEASLPYLQALIKETMRYAPTSPRWIMTDISEYRWRPIAPIAVPHSVIADDTYDGKFIPAGTTIIPNILCVDLLVWPHIISCL